MKVPTACLATALVTVATADAQIRFEDATEAAGLNEPVLGIMGHGGAFGDVDGDGLPDLYVGGFADRPDEDYAPAESAMPNVLLRNRGGGRFEPWEQKPVQIHARTSGAVFADLDNDGDPDLYVANNTRGRSTRRMEPQRTAQLTWSKLFRNDEGKLVDVSEESGACPPSLRTARNIGVFDFDGDGLLDLFVVEDKFTTKPRSVLFRNLGGLKFEDANAGAGLPDDIHGLGLAVADVNEDGRPDFFVANSNRMFLSAKENRFVESESLNQTFAWQPRDKEDWPCGAAFGDLNGDGRLDLVLSIHHVGARNRIYLNEGVENGVPKFRNVTKLAGLPDSEQDRSPHVEIQDFDNDGRPDIYFSTAWMNEDGAVTPTIYRNTGSQGGIPRFVPMHKPQAGDQVVYFPAGPSGDVDRDGRLDLFLINWFRGNHCRLMRNASPGGHSWLAVEVRGRTFNRQGIGTRVKVLANGKLLGVQELTTGFGYASGQEARCHFGLGKATRVDLALRFPNGGTRRIAGITDLNKLITIEE